ncbi:MAG: hypothetical protein R3A11_07905 [Bdellovibrionota bacterium]
MVDKSSDTTRRGKILVSLMAALWIFSIESAVGSDIFFNFQVSTPTWRNNHSDTLRLALETEDQLIEHQKELGTNNLENEIISKTLDFFWSHEFHTYIDEKYSQEPISQVIGILYFNPSDASKMIDFTLEIETAFKPNLDREKINGEKWIWSGLHIALSPDSILDGFRFSFDHTQKEKGVDRKISSEEKNEYLERKNFLSELSCYLFDPVHGVIVQPFVNQH